MTLDRNAAKKLASLSAVGLGVMGTAGEAEAAAIVIDAGNTMVGWKAGANLSYSHDFGGPRFLFDRFARFGGSIYSNGVDVHGYGGLDFLRTGSSFLRILSMGGTGGAWLAHPNPGIAYWHYHTSFSTSHTGGNSPFSNGYALFRFILSGQTHYGWIELSLINPLEDEGPTLTIHRFAWESVADVRLAAGDEFGSAVPEPSAFLMSGLGALGLGAAGIRRWRAAKKAA